MSERIPVSPMMKLYRKLKGVSQRERLDRAERMIAHPDQLAKRFAQSVASFEKAFDHVDEEFYEKVARGKIGGRKALPKKPKGISSTLEVAARLSGSGVRRVLGADELDFTYVDRELVPARTKSGATFAGGGSIRTAPRLDLLLASADGRLPIVAEVKVAMDKDPFFALVQALTLSAQLATPSQFERLRRCYGQRLATASQLDIYLLLANTPAAATHWFDLREAADRLSRRLIETPEITRSVRRIAALDLDLLDGRLRITKRFGHPTR